MEWKTLLAIITTVPAFAWFVNAFINIFKFYRKNESKIKEKAVDIKEKAEGLGEKIEDKIEEKFHKPQQQNVDKPENSGAEERPGDLDQKL